MAHRARLGQVLVIDPLGASGVKAARWSPLASCWTWAGAQQTAVQLANAIEQTPTEEQRPEHRFWKTMGTKFLAPMLFAAATKGLSMAEVLHWLDSREDQEVKDILEAAGVPAATDAWESSQYRTDRAVDSLYATAEEVLHVYGNERVSASTDGHDLDLEHFLCGDNTIYLYAPAHQQRLLRPLFETITQQVVAAAQEQAALVARRDAVAPAGAVPGRGRQLRRPVRPGRAGHHRPGQGIQLVTVWHDKSQLEARYGPKASTILNNHRAKLFLSGLADLSALELGARLIGDQALVDRNRSMGSDGRHSLNESTSYRPLLPVEDLRRLPRGGGAAVRAPAPDPDPAAALLRAAGAGPPPAGRGPRRSAGNAGRAAPWPQDRTGLQAHPAPPGPHPGSGGGGAGGLARAGRGPAMTLDLALFRRARQRPAGARAANRPAPGLGADRLCLAGS